jgi:hypothetical protein
MRYNHTAILFCLDETGSMGVVRDVTISAFNEFIVSQRREPGTAEVWLQRFNTEYRKSGFQPERFGDLGSVVPLSHANYRPTAMTPLYDAVGHMIEAAGREFAGRSEAERPAKVIVVVQTDGEENSSSEYTAARVREMIGHQREKYGWHFMFLGADQDAWVTGESLGIARQATLAYANNEQGVQDALNLVALTVSELRKGELDQARFNVLDIRPASSAG